MDIRPLEEHLPFGVRIRDITRDLLDREGVRATLRQQFETHGMIVFEDVEASDAMQLKLSLVFGPLKPHPVASVTQVDGDAMPGVIEIRIKANSGGLVRYDGLERAHWLPWHFDHCYNDELNRAGVLRATVITAQGGITGFLDGIELYRAFPPSLRDRIDGREIAYRLDTQYAANRFGRPQGLEIIRPKEIPPAFFAQAMAMPRAIHPAVWTRDSGEKVLHVSPYMAQGIIGAEDDEGDALSEEIAQTINRIGATSAYYHRWRPGDMLIWDNWRMLHSVSGSPPEEERVMQRTTIRGDYGLGRFENDGIGGAILENTMV